MNFMEALKIPFFIESIPEAPEWADEDPDEYVMEDPDFIAKLAMEEKYGTLLDS